MIAPCKHCNDRTIKCHSECDRYIKYRMQKDAEKKQRYKEIELDQSEKEGTRRMILYWKSYRPERKW